MKQLGWSVLIWWSVDLALMPLLRVGATPGWSTAAYRQGESGLDFGNSEQQTERASSAYYLDTHRECLFCGESKNIAAPYMFGMAAKSGRWHLKYNASL